MVWRNLTPHAIHIIGDGDAVVKTVEPDGLIPRVGEIKRSIGVSPDGIPLQEFRWGEPDGTLPAPVEGTNLIVSQIVCDALNGAGVCRDDLFVPFDLVRDEKGNIVGCRSLARKRTASSW